MIRVVVTGASGQLGTYAVAVLRDAGHQVIAWSGSTTGDVAGIPLRPVDLELPDAIRRALDDARPDAVLHLAAVSAAEAVRLDPARGTRINVDATRAIADWCALRDRRLLFTSTDLVFDGAKSWWSESDPVGPSMAYGRTKAEAERLVTLVPRGLVVRIPLQFGPSRNGTPSPIDRALATLRAGGTLTAFEDEFRTPLDYATTARGLNALLTLDRSGTIHLAARERMSRLDLMRRIAAESGLDPEAIRANRQADVPSTEARPADVSLDTARLDRWLPGFERPTIEEAVRSWAGA